MTQLIHQWLLQFRLHALLHDHVVKVMVAMPEAVRLDLMGDPCFVMHDYDPTEVMTLIPVASPLGSGPSRSVSLKRTLCHRPTEFVQWVIAHELAHAHLRNGGTEAVVDPEAAADFLAADWGFPRPVFVRNRV